MEYTLEDVKAELVEQGDMQVSDGIAWLGVEDYIIVDNMYMYRVVDNVILHEGLYDSSHAEPRS